MDFNSPAAGKEANSGSPFDVQGFKNLLDTGKILHFETKTVFYLIF